MGKVIEFSPSHCTSSEEIDNKVEKQQGEKTPATSNEEFQHDLEHLTKMQLATKYKLEHTSHRNRKSKAKSKWKFEFPVFKDFLAHMGPKDDPSYTLDRIDNSKGYVAGNMRWADSITQNNNKSDNILITVDGATKTLGQWTTDTQQSYNTLYGRYQKGWTHYEIVNGKSVGAIKAPTFAKKHASDWAECRPTDLPPGQQWPTQDMVERYERFEFGRYNGAELPICVWLAAYILGHHNKIRYPDRPDDWDPDYVDPNHLAEQQQVDRLVGRFNDVMTIAWRRFEMAGHKDQALEIVTHLSHKVT